MATSRTCPQCHQRLLLPYDFAEKSFQCWACRARFPIDSETPAPPASDGFEDKPGPRLPSDLGPPASDRLELNPDHPLLTDSGSPALPSSGSLEDKPAERPAPEKARNNGDDENDRRRRSRRSRYDDDDDRYDRPRRARRPRYRDDDDAYDRRRDRSPASDPQKWRKNGLRLFIGLAVGTLLIVVICVFALQLNPKRGNRSPLAGQRENENERREEIKQALVELKPVADEELAGQLNATFTRLNAAARVANGEQMAAQFDLERLADEFFALAPGVLTSREQRAVGRELKNEFKNNAVNLAPTWQWNSMEIRGIKKLSDTEVVLIARHEHSDVGRVRMRWWATRRDGNWKIYDYEDLDIGLRWSAIVASILRQGRDKMAGLGHIGPTLLEIRQALQAQDLDTAERKLKQIAAAQLPPDLAALRHLLSGALDLQRGQNDQALAEFDRAGTLQASMPVLDQLRGMALNRKDDHAQALKHLKNYHNLLGDDAVTCAELGTALNKLNRFDEATQFCRKSLDLDPKDADAFYVFIRSLAEGTRIDDVGKRFARLDNRRDNFDTFAADAEERRFDQLLEQLVTAMRKLDPEYPPVDYYSSLLKARARQPDEALRLFKSASAREHDAGKRQRYADGFIKAMGDSGNYDAAFAAAPNAPAAFRTLALEAIKSYRFDLLKRLVDAQGNNQAKHPLLPWCQATISCQDGNYALADRTFRAAAMDSALDDEAKQLFRMNRVSARYYTGQAMSAYQQIGPRDETFNQLVNLCWSNENLEQLQLLLNAHARFNPESVQLLKYRLLLKVKEDQLPAAIMLFGSILAKKLTPEERESIVTAFLEEFVQAGQPLQAYRAAPDPVEAFRRIADMLLEELRVAELRQLIVFHQSRRADDPWPVLYQADVNRIEQDWHQVIALLEPGIKQAPKEMSNDYRWRYTLAMYKTGRGLQAYAASEGEARSHNWTQLANLMLTDKNAAELKKLIAAHRPNAADSGELDYYEARIKVLDKQPAEATALLRKACRAPIEAWQRRNFESGFLTAMAEEGFALFGYLAAEDRNAAFETLAQQLVFLKKPRELAALLAEHATGRPADAALESFTGELCLLRGDATAAEQHFAAASSLEPASGFRRASYRLNSARVKAGNAMRAYRENGGGSQVFQQLAFLCLQEKDGRQLQELIDTHRKGSPDDARLPLWEVDALWLNQDYEGVVHRLKETHSGPAGQSAPLLSRSELFAGPGSRWKYEGYLVRSLVRLKRTDDAVREADALATKRSNNLVWVVLAHAASGDVNQTRVVLAKHRKKSRLVDSCYQDEDLGPILRSEPFRELRVEFPEPNNKPFDLD